MNMQFLDFEQPIAELEAKIEELKFLGDDTEINVGEEVKRLDGLGFMRLAIGTDTPIVPVGIVGAEEQSPAVADVKWLGRLVGSPAFPITPTFPWLGLAGFLPLPVKFRIRFGEPLRFEGAANEDDAAIEKRVTVVKKAIRKLLAEARAERQGWFS